MVWVYMDYFMGKITGSVVDDFFEQKNEEAKRANARAKARFLTENQGSLEALARN